MSNLPEIDLGGLDYDQPGTCPCGATIPPMREWDNPGQVWTNHTCTCGRLFVDEDDEDGSYVAVHDPEKDPT